MIPNFFKSWICPLIQKMIRWECTLTVPSEPPPVQRCGPSAADQLHPVWFSELQVDHLWLKELLSGHQPVTEVPVMSGQSEIVQSSICLHVVWPGSILQEDNLINTWHGPSLLLFCLFSHHLASLLPSGWLKPSPGWARPPHFAAAGSPDADWTGFGFVAPLWEEGPPACWTPEGQPGLSLNSQVCLWRPNRS